MSMKKAFAAPFATLLGRPRAEETDDDDDDDERKQRPDESDEDYAKRMEELDDKEKGAKGESGSADDVDPDAETDDSDDDDDKDKDKDKDAKKAARAQERARCARIIAHGIKIGAVRQAGVLAFDTGMSAKTAVAMLDAAQAEAPKRDRGLASRMAATSIPNPGSSSGAPLTLAQQMLAADKKRRGE